MRIIRLVMVSCCVGSACAENTQPPWEVTRDDLIAMEQKDQAVREGLTGAALGDTVRLREMLAVDSAHTQRLREIVEAYGWPEISDVGEDGAHAAWLLLQHSSDIEFQRTTLTLMEDAAERGEASRRSLALLTDRVLIHQDKPQRYGTQFKFVDGRLEFHPIEAPESVDERRASVGLPPLEDYRRMSEEFYNLEAPDTLKGPGGPS
ncbi:MAG: DUF6624 domain-containing protein [Planctomycetota bacterium]|jgi:hypothetical protein